MANFPAKMRGSEPENLNYFSGRGNPRSIPGTLVRRRASPFGESSDDEVAEEDAYCGDAREDWLESEEQERHPLLQQAMELLSRFDALFGDADPRFAASLSTLYRGAGDAMGGLAQALSRRDEDAEDYGLCVVQLKRALRGAAFGRGALFPLRPILSEEQFRELSRVLQQMETGIVSELGKVRLM